MYVIFSDLILISKTPPLNFVLTLIYNASSMQILMSVHEDWLDVVTTVLILLGAITVLVWMDLNYLQIITLVQVMHDK